MLSRSIIVSKTLARAGRQAQLVANRTSTSDDDRQWCIDLIATIAAFSGDVSTVLRTPSTGTPKRESIYRKRGVLVI